MARHKPKAYDECKVSIKIIYFISLLWLIFAVIMCGVGNELSGIRKELKRRNDEKEK